MRDPISEKVAAMKPSGIRKMFDIPPGKFRKRIREQMRTIPDRSEKRDGTEEVHS